MAGCITSSLLLGVLLFDIDFEDLTFAPGSKSLIFGFRLKRFTENLDLVKLEGVGTDGLETNLAVCCGISVVILSELVVMFGCLTCCILGLVIGTNDVGGEGVVISSSLVGKIDEEIVVDDWGGNDGGGVVVGDGVDSGSCCGEGEAEDCFEIDLGVSKGN